MSNIELTKDAIHFDCECGAHHKIYRDKDGELKIKSIYAKKEKKELTNVETKETGTGTGTENRGKQPDFFDSLFE